MEREALQVQQRIGTNERPLGYVVVAIAIWAGVAYGLLAPPAPNSTSRLILAYNACPK